MNEKQTAVKAEKENASKKRKPVRKPVAKRTSAVRKAKPKDYPPYKPLSWAEVFDGKQMPPLPTRLPAMIETTVSQTPELLRGTVAQAVLVAYSVYPKGLAFLYNDGRIRELRMNCLLVASEGGGKECVTLPVKHILAEIKLRSKADRNRLKQFNEEYSRKAMNKEKPQRPTDLDIRWLYPDITRPRLGQAMEDAQGGFLFLKMNELEDWDRVEGKSGRANSFSTMKVIDDEGNDFGQDRSGMQSVNADGCLRLNWLADTTMPKLRKYFRHIHGEGPISRIVFGSIPEVEIGAPMPVFGKYDENYDSSIRPYIENLKKATGVVVCKEAQRMVDKLKAEIDEFSTLSQDWILDQLSHRALVATFRKACLIYAANGMKWEPEIENFCRWSMQVDLYLKYTMFAEDIRKANEDGMGAKSGPKSLLADVTTDEQGVFSFNEVLRVYTASGREPDEKKVHNMLSQWKTRGYILQMTNDSYKKRSMLSE